MTDNSEDEKDSSEVVPGAASPPPAPLESGRVDQQAPQPISDGGGRDKKPRKTSNIFRYQHSHTQQSALILEQGADRCIPTTLPFPPSTGRPKARHEPGRTTKGTQKLVLFPEATLSPTLDEQGPAVSKASLPVLGLPEPDRELWEAIPLLEEESLRRVTAYLTAESYNLKALFTQVKKLEGGDLARRYDEVLYTPISISNAREPSPPLIAGSTLDDLVASEQSVGQVFYFDYGVVVIWGLREEEERTVLKALKPFEHDALDDGDVEVEAFHFCQSPRREHPCLFNDVVMLKSASKLVKLSISHALAQSVKLTYFEELVETTIIKTKDIPYTLAATGSINMPRKAITRHIGELLITRINVNLVSNVLDTPELFWSQQAWAPLYHVVRAYLEISQRVDLLNQRCAVISDMLDLLREHSNNAHGERLEWIVITLITIEVFLGSLELILSLTNRTRH